MKVLYFGFPSGGRFSGLKTFNLALIPELAAALQRRGATMELLAADPDLVALARRGVSVVPARREGILQENLALRWRALRARADVVFFPSSRLPCFWPRATPSVITMHDLLFFHFPERVALARRIFRRTMTRHALSRATAVAAVSAFTAAEVRDFGHAGPVTIIHEGTVFAEPPPAPPGRMEEFRARRRLPPEYFLFLGSQTFQKNLPALAEAFSLYAQMGGAAALVVAGFPSNDTANWHAALRRLPAPLRGRVLDLGPVDNEERALLYGGAKAVVMPSLYEGFGLPLLEALAMGKVPLYGAGSLPEIAGEAGLPAGTAPATIAAAMRRLETEPGLLEKCLSHRWERLERFTWARTAQTLAELLAEVAARSAGGRPA